MQLLLLGPFEVVTDLGQRRLPGRGERALLALLALSAGQVVPTSALVDALWSSGAAAPVVPSATATREPVDEAVRRRLAWPTETPTSTAPRDPRRFFVRR